MVSHFVNLCSCTHQWDRKCLNHTGCHKQSRGMSILLVRYHLSDHDSDQAVGCIENVLSQIVPLASIKAIDGTAQNNDPNCSVRVPQLNLIYRARKQIKYHFQPFDSNPAEPCGIAWIRNPRPSHYASITLI
ncbi:hypothetical protein CEXT_215651 [Caerostris extrusa]|uniref:Uncharacterized protein n=1 Tax=Caerostris extrusa TaxID=172846 RepID=A0AAV4U4I7_CAEEX|nr:hypothetical protein CEXT_215651 [Caerostris extrusa]